MFARNQLTTIDHHHGQASRTVIAGYPTIRGKTMREKAAYYLQHMSWVHESLIREPRGHRNMLGGILTEPVSETAAFGMLFLHANGLFDGCGDSTFCAAAAAIETGRVPMVEPVTRFSIDTVNGPLHIEADVTNGIVREVRFENIPSYSVGRISAPVPGWGDVAIDIAFGGNYFGFIDADSVRLTIAPESERQIIAAANRIWDHVHDKMLPLDPHTGKAAKIELFTFVKNTGSSRYKVGNVYKPGRMGRTPSGTGTSAHIALRHALGEYAAGDLFVQESFLGTVFKGWGKPHTLPAGPAVLPTIGTKSYLMGVHQFMIDPSDPYARGLVLEG